MSGYSRQTCAMYSSKSGALAGPGAGVAGPGGGEAAEGRAVLDGCPEEAAECPRGEPPIAACVAEAEAALGISAIASRGAAAPTNPAPAIIAGIPA